MNYKDMFKLKVIFRFLLKLLVGNKNIIYVLIFYFMLNFSGFIVILIICLFYEFVYLCYVKYFRFICIIN